MSKYGRVGISPRCTLKIDIQKAYDTLPREFLHAVMVGLHFPSTFISWVMECVRTVRYSIMVNGELEGFFDAQRGIRQGDPLSPFLFVLAMEYLSRMFTRLQEHPEFSYHPKCGKVKLTHICFADDLMVFCRGDVRAITAVKKHLDLLWRLLGSSYEYR